MSRAITTAPAAKISAASVDPARPGALEQPPPSPPPDEGGCVAVAPELDPPASAALASFTRTMSAH